MDVKSYVITKQRNEDWRRRRTEYGSKSVAKCDTLNENLSNIRMGTNSKHERQMMFDVLFENKQNSPVLTGFTASDIMVHYQYGNSPHYNPDSLSPPMTGKNKISPPIIFGSKTCKSPHMVTGRGDETMSFSNIFFKILSFDRFIKSHSQKYFVNISYK